MRARVRIQSAVLGATIALAALLSGPARSEPTGSLADDGRVGVVTDLQGTALVRPTGRTRWSPVGPRSVLLPGDEVRTMARGAHAVEIRLPDGGSLVLGPDGLAQFESRGRVRLMHGDAEITGAAAHVVTVTGPGGFETKVEKATVLRVANGATSTLAEPPRWLTGYRGSTTDEWMGSLLANVDGRNVSLSVGYHKVGVTIRDQIAETTVEESFVNSTDSTLEGVFSFPLPAGASISGFGMWVGEELVEADIVEREKARAIYEDIKARRKDPGLLEWSGGNLFKASVFPIFAHSEKRIRLRYTQVLPLEGTIVRYRYALRSEMLRTHPLRELQIHVAAQSSAPFVSATSPTHEVRTTSDAHTATIDFSASEFTPDRDFEVVFKLDATSPLRVVPHRRGDDGYFMLLVAPPDASAGAWKRDLVPEGSPLDVLFVADTSGSMGPADRRAQHAFIELTLSLLGPADRFRLMACDANVVWLGDEALPATDDNAARAMQFLDRRISLGWSDLDKALAAAAGRASERTLIVYVGDGIGTVGDADPVALAQRIGRMTVPAGAAFHAVATGSSYEQGVLEAMAARGGGSVRSVGDDPAKAAYALLSEVAQPAVKDLQVAFEGLRTARVYPDKLPNLPAGAQQIVLGRFLPEGASEQRGRVTVTGTLAGKPVSYSADLVVAPGAEGMGNSFLPRLWARRHLDALLAQGRTPAIKDEIVSMSESYGIITPYTSFLVLENDEDRERYGVARRVAMRDGERFFTEGRTAAATAALRVEMQKARSWRLGLRRSMLAEISGLGRGIALGVVGEYPVGATTGGGGGRAKRPSSGAYRRPGGEKLNMSEVDFEGDGGRDQEWSIDTLSDATPPDSREPSDPEAAPESMPASPRREEVSDSDDARQLDEGLALPAEQAMEKKAVNGPAAKSAGYVGGFGEGGSWSVNGTMSRRDAAHRAQSGQSWLGQQLFQRFPGIPAPPAKPPAPPEVTWDAEVAAALASVSEPTGFAPGADARVEITWRDGAVGPVGPDFWPMSTGRALAAADRWFVRARSAGSEPYEQWLAQDRGVLATGTRLGRRRPGAEGDRGEWTSLVGRPRIDFARSYPKWTAKIESRDGALVVVALTAPSEQKNRVLVTIDTDKHVVVLQRTFYLDKLTGSHRADGFVRAGGLWWATEESQRDAADVETWRKTLAVREIPAAEFDASLTSALSGQENVIFLGAVDPPLAEAKQAVHANAGTFVHHLTIAADHAAFQRWDDAWGAWEKARALVDAPALRRPGADWIEATLLSMSRRGERFATQMRALADSVVKNGGPAADGLARQLHQLSQNGMQANERLTLLDVLEKAADVDADAGEARWLASAWAEQRAVVLFSAGRQAEAIAIWRALWKARPKDPQRCVNLMNALVNTGDVDGALELFNALDFTGPTAKSYLVPMIFQQLANALWNANRFDRILEVADRWIALTPDNAAAYQDRLSAMLALDRIDEFDRWVGEHLVLPADPAGDATSLAQLHAAVALALGQDRFGRWYGNQADPQWVRPLAVLARSAARNEKIDVYLAAQIVNDYRWRTTDGHRELLGWLRDDLVASGGVESPAAARLVQLLSWLPWDRNQVDAAVWRGVTDRVESRLRAAKADDERRALLGSVLALLDAHLEPDEAVRVLRDELVAATPARVPEVVDALLARLVRTPWTQAMEDEAFALVPRLATAEMKPDQKRVKFAGAARWIVERLSAVRNESALPPQVEREKLPRAELKARQLAARIATRRALAARLSAEVKTAQELLRPWYEIERLGLAAELGDDPKAVEAETRELLLSIPAPTALSADDVDDASDHLTWVLRERCVLALTFIAVRRDAPDGLADRVLSLLRERLAKDDKTLDWRYAIFRLLVALDRPVDLETSLREWVVPAHVESRWRRALGYLLAETGRVKEAAEQFEEVARLDEMGEGEFVTLAAWYLVLGDDARRSDALDRRYATVNEYELSNRIGREQYRVRSRGPEGVPPTMDDEVLRIIRVALSKSSNPQNVLYNVRSLYASVKDFRLLASIADGVVGHTPEAVYPFLQSAHDMIQEVHEEATCDEVRARLQERLASAKTDTDRRGLGLLMVVVERRAAEVLNQPGPHIERALADLRRARQGAWLPGERRLMAEFLASLGRIPDTGLAAEQLSQLKELHGLEAPGGLDRFRIAHALARTQWSYGRTDEAIDVLVAALDEHRQAGGGVLPAETNDLADVVASWHESLGRYAVGETWLAAEQTRQKDPAQQQWYARRTFRLWLMCLQNGGTVSLGSGGDLYRAAREKMERALADHAPDRLGEVLTTYCELHRVAHRRANVKSVGDDLVRFSRTLLVEVLPRFGQQSSEQVRQVAEAIRDVAGPLPALTLLVERLETEPAWYSARGRGYGGWQCFSYRIADWRREAGALGALEPRLLARVLREEERDLVSEESHGRALYGGRTSSNFWQEKLEDFTAVARKVIAENPEAAGRLRHTATYLWNDLELKAEAVQTLEVADRRGALREDGRWLLVQWRQELKQFAESLPHAEKLVAERPDNIDYRLANIRALHGVGRDDDGKALVDATRAHFVELRVNRRSGVGTNAQLADVCVECGYFDRAVALYPEAISDRRLAVRGGRGDSELSHLYAALAHGLAGLGRYDEAVDAASSAVVIWGSNDGNRENALRALRDVLASIPDLAAWTARWEAEAAKSGTDAPVVRLTLAGLHLERKAPDAALRHLLVARAQMPDDAAVHASIVRAYEMKKDAAGLCDALATSLHRLPNQPDLYARLAECLRGLHRDDEAERALTGLAEYAPNESDGHARLAAIRTKAGRHEEASVQWRQVVRIRSKELTGWLELARSLARAGRKDEAHAALDDVMRNPWAAGQRQAVEAVSREIDAR